ncbi:hypothetical protein E5345_08105 [Propionibacterium sp. NM47_B9-13]|jgi:hypothetical protein|uniref:Uncharacterized protein n=2 Tax=Cutibacterium modestum TaxID=2559073 RepID=A0AAD1NV98_9ACTN|nr:hypothetical protein HMPREF9621_02232 [Cutibacterium modestum HL037PA2]EFS92342.1 hypothetical protein HMPREF9607_01427 [Cutibacterium modestum HL044PA1]EFT14565.1 hypothetical protein HMPREF9622_02420 [Cutibacterium modestum HL037PA3]TGY28823.1 hypothetical protein E5345_08105 [Propionibacterium sp. NM47_B9-13]BCY24519.1 hypothetical protein KB1_05090 [Cutibacterium modestum]
MSTPPHIKEDISRMIDETPPSGKHRGIGALAAVATWGPYSSDMTQVSYPGRFPTYTCPSWLAVSP